MTTVEELQERIREAKKPPRYVLPPVSMTPMEELEQRVRALEEHISVMENARFSVGMEHDGIPGRPEYATWQEAKGQQLLGSHTFGGQRWADSWRIWDHSVSPPRNVTKGLK